MKQEVVNIKRKVNVIEDIDGRKTVFIHDIIFKGKKSVNWDDVEKYLKQYVGLDGAFSQKHERVPLDAAVGGICEVDAHPEGDRKSVV